MYSSRTELPGAATMLAIVLASVVVVPTAWSQEDDVSPASTTPSSDTRLRARPVTCIALHKEQICFQEVTLSWSTLEQGDYCLYVDERKRPLTCWFHNSLRNYTHNYQSADSMRYELREGSSDDVMAEVIVNTSWVYRTGRRSSSGWRLF